MNLVRHSRVSMPALRDLLTELGYEDVRTYLQSGNVVLTSRKAPARLAKELEQAVADELGVTPRVVVRTRTELAAVVRRDPFGSLATDPKRYQVTFLSEAPAPEVVAEVENTDCGDERVVFSGREAYAWHPNGIQKSKLARELGRALRAEGTARNWNTVTKLLELADE